MAYKLSFGKHVGKSLEWLFFNDPGYVEYIMEKKIHEDPAKFSAPMRDRFIKLVNRASYLILPGVCSWCKKKPITRMFMTQHTSGGLASVTFDCEDCRPMGSSNSSPCKPSFFTPDFYRNYDKFGARELIRAIKYAYFGDGAYRMTQKRMEDFFDNRSFFVKF